MSPKSRPVLDKRYQVLEKVKDIRPMNLTTSKMSDIISRQNKKKEKWAPICNSAWDIQGDGEQMSKVEEDRPSNQNVGENSTWEDFIRTQRVRSERFLV